MALKKRFIAGAKCPSCGALDRIVMYQQDGRDIRECVACKYHDVMHFKQQTRELETRVNVTEEQKKTETSVVKFLDPGE